MDRDCFLFRGGRLWTAARADGTPALRFPARSLEPEEADCAFAESDDPPVPGAEALDLRDLFGRVSDAELAAAVRARELLQWRLDNRFCSRCAAPLARHADPAEHAMVCPACGAAFYPRLSPAVIVLVERAGGEEVLLEKPVRGAASFWRLVAGFVEAGETAEEAVAREIAEETGVRVRNVRYLSSQSWPFPGSLMLAFRAEWAEGEPRPDGTETAECRFFRRSALPALPPGMSIARRMVEAWAAEAPGADDPS